MSQQQHFEFSEENRKYWSAENLVNRLTDTAVEELTWENKALTKSLHLEKARVTELTQQLEAAKKRIRELTGEQEPEEKLEEQPPEDEDFENMPQRSYCGEEFCKEDEGHQDEEAEYDAEYDAEYEAFIDSEMKTYFRKESTGMKHTRAQYYNRGFDYIEDVDDEEDNENNSFFGTLPVDGETLEPEGNENNSFFGILPVDGEALEPESFHNNNGY